MQSDLGSILPRPRHIYYDLEIVSRNQLYDDGRYDSADIVSSTDAAETIHWLDEHVKESTSFTVDTSKIKNHKRGEYPSTFTDAEAIADVIDFCLLSSQARPISIIPKFSKAKRAPEHIHEDSEIDAHVRQQRAQAAAVDFNRLAKDASVELIRDGNRKAAVAHVLHDSSGLSSLPNMFVTKDDSGREKMKAGLATATAKKADHRFCCALLSLDSHAPPLAPKGRKRMRAKRSRRRDQSMTGSLMK